MTDKYKGHTEGPWIIVDEGDVWDIFGETANGLGEYVTTIVMEDKGVANAHLIVDAPKLLEENKRLREALERLIFANRNAFMRAVFDEGYETALIDAEKTLKENDDD